MHFFLEDAGAPDFNMHIDRLRHARTHIERARAFFALPIVQRYNLAAARITGLFFITTCAQQQQQQQHRIAGDVTSFNLV